MAEGVAPPRVGPLGSPLAGPPGGGLREEEAGPLGQGGDLGEEEEAAAADPRSYMGPRCTVDTYLCLEDSGGPNCQDIVHESNVLLWDLHCLGHIVQ